MQQPRAPRLEDFGLSKEEYAAIPRLFGDSFTEPANTKISAAIGTAVGLGAIWGFFGKTDSMFTGFFFGVLIGFVVFLLASFFGGVFVVFVVKILSVLQKYLMILVDKKARRAYRFDAAMDRYRAEMKAYEAYSKAIDVM
tara:strand:- start:54 stop:473 length:420 start_codon:yes stop_codon:yes gene_type:complete